MDKAEVDIAIAAIQGIIKLVESIDPKAAENNIVIALNKVIGTVQALGL